VKNPPLADRNCRPLPEGTPCLGVAEARVRLRELNGWAIERDRLVKAFGFPDFSSALAFVNRVGEVAEAEDHHPDVALSRGRVVLSLWTHAAGGLTENDFILAAKCDRLL
jgi:4a-hydroxytetrahydrobiopterin dehydratase